MQTWLWIGACIALGFNGPAPAHQMDADLATRLEALVERLESARVENHIPGMSLAVVLGDEVVLARGFGLRDIEAGLPAEPTTRYAIGSATKAFTSLLVGMMVDEERMSWDEPARTRVPEFRLSDPDADAQVTIRDLLCHRSGLGRTDLLWYGGGATQAQVFEGLSRAEPASPFRTAFNYNNIGYLAAGLAAARADETDWESMVSVRIFEPLGMAASDTSIGVMMADAGSSNGYLWDADAGEYRRLPMRSIASCAPAGAINSTALDMARWVRLLLGRGEFEGRRLVSEESLGETWTGQIEVGGGVSYGLGWMLHEWDGDRVVEHGGNIDGFASQVALLPDRDAGYVLLTNVSATPLAAASRAMVWEALFPPDSGGGAELTEAQMERYTGKFRSGELGADVTVLVKDGRLHCDVPGQTVYELKWPDETGRWAFALTDTIQVLFDTSGEGPVPSLTMEQGGMNFRMMRVNADGTVAKGTDEPSPFTADALRAFTGTYRFAEANQDWRVLVRDERLAVDVPGQTVYTLNWPDADGMWALSVTDAVKIAFARDEAGAVTQLLCHQGGAVMTMPRTAPGDDAELPTIDALMDLRMRGTDAAAALGVVRASGDLRFASQGIDASFVSIADQHGRFRTTIDMDEFGRIEIGSDGATVWTRTLGLLEVLTGDRAAAARREANNLFARDIRDDFDVVEVLRRDQVGGAPVIVVRGRSAKGDRAATQFVDAETGLTMKEEATTTIPGVGAVPSTSLYENYEDFGGVVLPETITVESFGSGRSIITIKSVEGHVEGTDFGPGER